MELNGIDLDTLTQDDCSAFPSIVEGRVLQLDGDVVVYQCGYDDTSTLESCFKNYMSVVDFKRKMAGAEFVNVHLTYGDKGGRYNIATVKEYQGTRRKTRAKTVSPVNLKPLKGKVASYTDISGVVIVIAHEHQEADDGMTQGNYSAIKAGTPELSVICSIDKDLCMCSGFHMDWHSYKLTFVQDYGSIELVQVGRVKKIKGFGTSFFFAQMLMGDTADDIPGIPEIHGSILNKVDRTKKVISDLGILQTHTEDSVKYIKAKARLDTRKPKKCGAALAYKMLKDCTNDVEAYHVVLDAYLQYYGEEFTHVTWNGLENKVNFIQMVLEQGRLLWMRRVENEDVSIFFKHIGEKTWTD